MAIALVLCPALGLFLLLAPVPVFALLAALAGVVALREVHSLCGMGKGWQEWFATVVSLAVGATFYAADPLLVVWGLALGIVLLLGSVLLRTSGSWKDSIQWVLGATFALMYVVAPLGLLVLVRRGQAGATAVTIIVLGTWSRDIGAFLTGRAWTGRPIRPDLNLHKHWIGALGGLVVAVLVVAAVNELTDGPLDLRDVIVLGTIVGIFGQAGDLFESLLKREAGSRHSGVFLPDQGGLLDSIDGLLFAGPVASGYLLLLRPLGM